MLKNLLDDNRYTVFNINDLVEINQLMNRIISENINIKFTGNSGINNTWPNFAVMEKIGYETYLLRSFNDGSHSEFISIIDWKSEYRNYKLSQILK